MNKKYAVVDWDMQVLSTVSFDVHLIWHLMTVINTCIIKAAGHKFYLYSLMPLQITYKIYIWFNKENIHLFNNIGRSVIPEKKLKTLIVYFWCHNEGQDYFVNVFLSSLFLWFLFPDEYPVCFPSIYLFRKLSKRVETACKNHAGTEYITILLYTQHSIQMYVLIFFHMFNVKFFHISFNKTVR